MGISIVDNFDYLGKKPLDGRRIKPTIADMLSIAEYDLPKGFKCFVVSEWKDYIFNPEWDDNGTTGKWRVWSGSGGDESDGKIKIDENDSNPDYISNKIDTATLEVDGGKIKVISIDGLVSTIDELNYIQGLDKNIMDYLSLVEKAMTFRGFLDDDAAIEAIAQGTPKPIEGDTYIVKSSASHGDQPTYFTWAEKKDTDPKEYEFVAWPVPSGGGSEVIEREDGVTEEFGDIKKGMSLKDMTTKQVIEKMFWKYYAPEIGISISPSTTIYEKNVDTVNSLTITAKVKKNSENITWVKFYVAGTEVHKDETEISSATKDVTYTYTTPISDTTTIKVECADKTGKTVDKSTTITWTEKGYYGFVANGIVVDEASIKTLQHTTLNTVKTATFNGITCNDSKVVYAYPQSRGNLTQIEDANGFKYLDSFNKESISVDGVTYNVYVMKDAMSVTNGVLKFT